nr:hypothetical protein [Pseudomonas aeruginosa]
MGAKPKAQTVGFRYFFDIHFTLGKKIDELCALRASGKTAWKGSITTNGQVRINARTCSVATRAKVGSMERWISCSAKKTRVSCRAWRPCSAAWCRRSVA